MAADVKRCMRCGHVFEFGAKPHPDLVRCPKCGGILFRAEIDPELARELNPEPDPHTRH